MSINFDKEKFFIEAKQALYGVELDDKKITVKTFLNRLLGCTVEVQNAIFDYFEAGLENEIILAKREGRFENGIDSIDLSSKDILDTKIETISLRDNRKIFLHQYKVKDGMNFKEVFAINSKNSNTGQNMNGFYYARYGYYTNLPILAIQASTGVKIFL